MRTLFGIGFLWTLAGVVIDPACGEYKVNDPPYPGSREHVGVFYKKAQQRFFYDRRSLVKTHVFAEHASEAPEPLVDFAEPRSYYLLTARKEIRSKETHPPVKVLHMKAGGKPAAWKIGTLPVGTYMLRVIGAIPASDQGTKKHLVISFTINDRCDGSKSRYVLRGRGVDSFYCVQEFGFHVEDARELSAEVGLLEESDTSLFCYNLEVHDILAGCAKQAAKKAPSYFTLKEREVARAEFNETEAGKKMRETIQKEARAYSPEERAKRDEEIWNSVPGINVMFREGVQMAKGDAGPPLKADFLWSRDDATKVWLHNRTYGGMYGASWDKRFALVYDTWGGSNRRPYQPSELYTREDYLNHRPLGDTGDRGWGIHKGNDLICPVARVTADGWQFAARALSPGNADRYHLGGDETFGRDTALLLCRLAYELPIFSPYHAVSFAASAADVPWLESRFYQWDQVNERFAVTYDKLFPLIQGNAELSAAVGRFVPWVKSSEDVVKLLDSGLIQYMAKNVIERRFEYDNDTADILLSLVVAQGDARVSEPWLEHMWTTGVYFYPVGLQPLPHQLSTNTTRDGSSEIGSHFYTADGGPAFRVAKLIDLYMRQGGLAKYDLRDFNRYPEAVAGCYFPLESTVAGRHYLGIGDVGGPSVAYGYPCHPEANAREGWRWTKDRKFASLIAKAAGRKYESDEEWEEILKAAEGVPDPIMHKRSRVLSDWSGILESGMGQPDFRFHAAAAVRVGWGYGHQHNDALDLRVWAHGLNMIGDFGQRGGYGKPSHSDTRCHNVVQIDEEQYHLHSWVSGLSDLPGVQALQAEAAPSKAGALLRQTALIDVDSGRPSEKPSPWLDTEIETPNVYVFDVFRARGGSTHTFCFHGCVDDLNFEVNVPDAERKLYPRDDEPERAKLEAEDAEARFLKDFRWSRRDFVDEEAGKVSYMGDAFRPNDAEWAATCKEDVLQATWRLARQAEQRMVKGVKPEKGVGGAMTAPRKFTRLHLFEAKDLRILHGIVINKPKFDNINPEHKHYAGRCVFARKPAVESVFVSVVEPFAGEPFIRERKCLKVESAAGGMDRPVAVELKVRVRGEGGKSTERTDLLFADRSGTECRIPSADLTVQADLAVVQSVAGKIVRTCMTRGKKLKLGELEIVPGLHEYRSRIAIVDYRTREVTLDKRVPETAFKGAFVGIGDAMRSTNFEVADAFERNGVSVLKLRKSLELKRTRVSDIRPAEGGTCIELPIMALFLEGVWAANADYSRVWRVKGRSGAQGLLLEGEATEDDFKANDGEIVTLEIGAGQEVWLPGKICVQQTADGSFAVESNIPVKVKTPGGAWKEIP